MELKDNTVIVVLGASGDLAKKKTASNALPTPMCANCLTICNSILLSLVS
jgi:glucose-6-phosphate 1-dehydrogenase